MHLLIRLCLILSIPASLIAGIPRSQQMLNDLEFISNLFEISYAPLDWKQEKFGWDLELQKNQTKSLVTDRTTTKEFQCLIKTFCQSVKDYHVVPQFHSTEWATLPFEIQGAGGRFFITGIDNESTPFSIGDEILSLDGVSIKEAIDEFRCREIGNNNPETDQGLAEFYLTARFGSLGHEIPKGSVEVAYLPLFSDDIQTFKMDWNYHSEEVNEIKCLNVKSLAPIKSVQLPKDFYHKKFMTPHSEHFNRLKRGKGEALGEFSTRRCTLPPLGTILWESPESSEFHAYLFLMDDWEVCGYVRIPTYYVDGDVAAEEFAEIIEVFEELADAVVIDQLNNGGGLVLYLYALAAMLTDYDLDVPMHRVKLTQEDVHSAIARKRASEHIKNDRAARKMFGNTFQGVVVDYKLSTCFQNANQFIIDQWNAGKIYTDYGYLYGIDKIRPHPEVRYTKPILVLTNSLNFSAADFFPAIMQDNKRAKIMGSRTAGAGGYINPVEFPNLSGIEAIDFTASFSIRPDGTPVENFGVTPDILYEVSQNDLQNNYSDYKLNILKELRILVSEK